MLFFFTFCEGKFFQKKIHFFHNFPCERLPGCKYRPTSPKKRPNMRIGCDKRHTARKSLKICKTNAFFFHFLRKKNFSKKNPVFPFFFEKKVEKWLRQGLYMLTQDWCPYKSSPQHLRLACACAEAQDIILFIIYIILSNDWLTDGRTAVGRSHARAIL